MRRHCFLAVLIVASTAGIAAAQSALDTAGISIAGEGHTTTPICYGSASPVDTLSVALVVHAASQAVSELTFRVRLNTTAGGMALEGVQPAVGYSASAVLDGDDLTVSISPVGGCRTIESPAAVAFLQLLGTGKWEWLHLAGSIDPRTPAIDYLDCAGAGREFSFWGCLEIDINDPHPITPLEEVSFGSVKAQF
jgi:hypothetical protein